MATPAAIPPMIPFPMDESFLRKDHFLSIYSAMKNWSRAEQRKFFEEHITNVGTMKPLLDYLFSSDTIHKELLFSCFKLAFLFIIQKSMVESKSAKRKNSTSLQKSNRKSARIAAASSAKPIMPPPPPPTKQELPLEPEEILKGRSKSPKTIITKGKASDFPKPKPEEGSPEFRDQPVRKYQYHAARKFAKVVYQGSKESAENL